MKSKLIALALFLGLSIFSITKTVDEGYTNEEFTQDESTTLPAEEEAPKTVEENKTTEVLNAGT